MAAILQGHGSLKQQRTGQPADTQRRLPRSLRGGADTNSPGQAKIIVRTNYQKATPNYLAGWNSGTQDLTSGLKSGLVSHDKEENLAVSIEE